MNLKDRLPVNLGNFEPIAIEAEGLNRAAVALAIWQAEDGTHNLIMTKRAPRLNRHAGQWALPGGRVDEGETEEEAARREMDEEIGLALPPSALLGRLDDYEARSGFAITPFVYWAGENPTLTPDPGEVAAIHDIPISVLEDAANFELAGDDGKLIRFHFRVDHMHAPTAAILYQFAEVALQGRQTRVADLRSPGWAK